MSHIYENDTKPILNFSHCSAGGCSTSSCNPGGYHNGYTNGIDPHG